VSGDVEIETDELTGLDFRAELPCEGTGHGDLHQGPAVWVMRFRCINCGPKAPSLSCEERRQHFIHEGLSCGTCGVPHVPPLATGVLTFTPIPEATS